MRAFRLLNLALLSVLVASSAALYAQDEKQQDEKPRQEEPKRPEEPKQQEPKQNNNDAKPASRQDEMKTPRQDEAKPSKQEQKQEGKQEEKQSRDEMKQGRQEQEGHARPTGKSGHIPDDRFRARFGRSHTFRAQRPVVVEGQPRFEYSGYTFALIDVWPADWAYSDDCYIDYVDGEYFLFDLLHPGMRIALFVVM
jgi:hypothetical protein